MKTRRSLLAIITLLALAANVGATSAQGPIGTAFTYQGRLANGGAPANGPYDFQFKLFDAASAGAQIGSTIGKPGVGVVNGLFVVSLDFGSAFNSQARYLEIAVRPGGSPGAYSTLSPRQQLTATPNALFSSAPWVTSGSGIYFLQGNVGVGTTTPSAALSVVKSGAPEPGVQGVPTGVKIGTPAGTIPFALRQNAAESTLPTLAYFETGSGNLGYLAAAPSTFIFGALAGKNLGFNVNGNTRAMTLATNGNVGIGTSTPAQTLDVRGIASLGAPGGIYGYMVSSASPGPYPTLGFNAYGNSYQAGVSGYGGILQFQSGDGSLIYYSGPNVTTGVTRTMIPQLIITNDGLVRIGTTYKNALTKMRVDSNGVLDTAVEANGGLVGVQGNSTNGDGVDGSSTNGSGVSGFSTNGYAGFFDGKVHITGPLEKPGGSFKIDDPIDPANKYLYQSFVESPDMKNIYDGVATLDANVEATVTLPDWFEALNGDFRYQLTSIGGPGPNLYIAEEVQNNHFKIAGGKAGLKVSWQVTGIRHDPWAEQHRIPVEELKPPQDRGKYLYPKEYGQPDAMGIDYAMQQQVAQHSVPTP